VIRGISDHANPAKNDSEHASAARNAFYTLKVLLPALMAATRSAEERG
jgi:hypothetical protein